MNPHYREQYRSTIKYFLIYLLLAAGLTAGNYLSYQSYARHFRSEIDRQLTAINVLKVDGLTQWRNNRLGEGSIIFKNPVFSTLVRRFLENSGDLLTKQQINVWLGKYVDNMHYERVSLLDTKGEVRLSIPKQPEPISAVITGKITEIMKSDRVIFQDFYRSEHDGRIHLEVLVPIRDGRGNGRSLGVIVLCINPEKYLYPFIQRWPTPSDTAETLLVRREGEDVLYLNELRFQKDSALKLRVPLNRRDSLAAKAILGWTGVFEGLDYRGYVPIIAALRAVPDSPWFMASRMDKSELFAPLQARLRQTIGGEILLLIIAGGGLLLVLRTQRVRYYQERYIAAEALRDASSRQQAILAAVSDIIMEVDRNLVYTWANRPGIEFFGDGVVGRKASYYFEDEQGVYDKVQPLLIGSEELVYIESWQRRKDGEKRLLAWWCSVNRDGSGRITGAISSARDITEQKRAEAELRHKNDELERFTYTISHDLKSPLVTVKTFLGYLEQDIARQDSSRIGQDISYMRNASDKMGRLLDELLEMLRVGRVVNEPVSVMFMELVQGALEVVAGQIAERGVKILVEEKIVALYGDRPRLTEIWQNLIENGVKYMGDQPAPCLEIGVSGEGSDMVFIVRDNGIGIDHRYYEKIFSLFDKLDPDSEGTGLGLALVKRIVEHYAGRIWVESEGLGHGSCFRFTLPNAVKGVEG